MESKQIPLVFVEGGIGCGKSTLVKHIQEYCERNNLRFLTIQEPVDLWNHIKDKNEQDKLEESMAQQSSKKKLVPSSAYSNKSNSKQPSKGIFLDQVSDPMQESNGFQKLGLDCQNCAPGVDAGRTVLLP